MNKFILFISASVALLTLGCNRSVTTIDSSGMIIDNINALRNSNNSSPAIYVGGAAGGFFSLADRPPYNIRGANTGVFVRRRDGKIYVRDEYLREGIVRPEWFGAKGDGRSDDWEAFKLAIQVVSETTGTLVTGNKSYHISKPVRFPSRNQFNCQWIGNGATFDHTIIIGSRLVTLRDLNVENSPAEGFIWKRGQGGLFENLMARGCKKVGFGIGCEEGNQVAWATFNNLVSIENEVGFMIDGSFRKNWVNANNFTGFYARNNRGQGVIIKGVANYNTWIGLHCEGNDTQKRSLPAVSIEKSKDNVFLGGHFVSHAGNTTPTVVDNGARNIYLGGRYVAGSERVRKVIDNKNSQIDLSHKVTRSSSARGLRSRAKERKLRLEDENVMGEDVGEN